MIGYLKNISCFICIFSTVIFNAQDKNITIVDAKKQAISQVGIYTQKKKIGETNALGKAIIGNMNPNDSVYFIKNGLDNPVFTFKNIPLELKMDSIRTSKIEEVVIKSEKIDVQRILNKVFMVVRDTTLNVPIRKYALKMSLATKEKTYYTIDNIFFQKGKELFVESKNNFYIDPNFASYSNTAINDTGKVKRKILYKDEEFMPLRGADDTVFLIHFAKIQMQILNLIREYQKYDFKIWKIDGKYILKFSPKKEENRLYNGSLIIDTDDFGIYEGIFKLSKSKKNTQNTSIDEKSKAYKFFIDRDDVMIINQKNNGKYYFHYYENNYQYRGLNNGIKNETFYDNTYINPINNVNIDTAIPFDFNKMSFK